VAADPPPASFQLDFTGDSAIWNPFEGFESCEDVPQVGRLCLEMEDVVCNGKGSCTGNATFTFTGTLEGTMTGPATGPATGKEPSQPGKPVCTANAGFQTDGMLVAFGMNCSAKINGKMNGPVDATGLFSGNVNAHLCVECAQGHACDSAKGALDHQGNMPTP